MFKSLAKQTGRGAAKAAASGGLAATIGKSATRGTVDVSQLALKHLDTLRPPPRT